MTHKLPSDYLAQGWCHGTDARNNRGEKVEVDDLEACSWCLYGAIGIAWIQDGISLRESTALQAWMVTRAYTPRWNDGPGRTQAEVVAVMLEAEAAVLGRTTEVNHE